MCAESQPGVPTTNHRPQVLSSWSVVDKVPYTEVVARRQMRGFLPLNSTQ